MASVTGKTADAMDTIADASITTGVVNGSGDLILTTHGGDDINAGHVKGADGADGATGATGATGAPGADGAAGAPSGSIVMYGAATAPTGWHLCDGSAISRTTYAALFAIIGTTFGTGDGSTTFNVPNMQSKYPRQDTSNLGVTGGADTHSHEIDGGTTPAVAHVVVDSSGAPQSKGITAASWTSNKAGASFGSGTTAAQTLAAEVVGVTATATNDPPYLNLNFIIKT